MKLSNSKLTWPGTFFHRNRIFKHGSIERRMLVQVNGVKIMALEEFFQQGCLPGV